MYHSDHLQTLKTLFSCLDYTSLSSLDNDDSVSHLCLSALSMRSVNNAIPSVAAVCVYLPYVKLAKQLLKDSNIHVATVVGGFPHGQMPSQLKVSEIKYALSQGADEVDLVINRGQFLASDALFDEVSLCKQAAGNNTLKVILETSDLAKPDIIEKAAYIVLSAGADFVKTSTGKSSLGATPHAVEAILSAMQLFCSKNEKMVGLKVSGGISSLDEASTYLSLFKKYFPSKVVDNKVFRIGSSKLTPIIYNLLANQ